MIGMPAPYDRVAHIERFNEYLIRAVVKGECCTGGGAMVDHQTMGAIDQVAAAHPNPDPALIRAARAEFAKELDGTHTAEDGAWWRATLSAGYSEWPQTPFSDSMKTAFDHVLTFVNGPWSPEELDYARENLAYAVSADTAVPQLPRQALIVMLMRAMIDAVAVSPDYKIGEDTDEEPQRRFAERTRVALKYLVKFVEEPASHELEISRINLTNAAEESSCSSTRSRYFGIIVEHLRLILEALERRHGR